MKLVKNILFLGLVTFLSINSNAQCFEIESILVDACGSPEGENEMVRFKVGSADLCTDDMSVNWANASNNWLGITQNASTAQITTDLNATIQSCGFLKEPTSCVLPANSTVLLITSTDIDISANSFANLGDTLYVIFQTAGNTNGHFANYNSSPGLRTLTINFSSPIGCTDVVTYERSDLVNINGTTGGSTADKNGATANFTAAGVVSYSNTGCQAPFTPYVIDITGTEVNSGTTVICPGDVIQVGVTVTGPYQEIIWSGFNGTFDAQDVTSTNYNSAVSDNVPFYIVVGVKIPCGDTIQDSIQFTINASPTVTPLPGTITTSDGIQNLVSTMTGGVWSVTPACVGCINTSTGAFDPAVSGEGTFSVCHTAGCGQDCITIVIDNSCTMNLTVTANSPTCFNGNDGDINVAVSGVSGTAIFEIMDASNVMMNATTASNVANNLIAGIYTISVTDDLCTVTTTDTLFNQPEIEAFVIINEPNCYGIADGFAYVDTINPYQGVYSDVSFLWRVDVDGAPTVLSTIDTLTNFGEGDYTLEVSDAEGCTIDYEFTIVYPDSIHIELEVTRSAICRDNLILDNPDGQLFALATGGKDDGAFPIKFWTQLSTGNTDVGSTWGPIPAGTYMYTVEDQYGCTATRSIVLDSLSPIAAFSVSSPQFTSNYNGTAPVEVTFENNSTNYSFANNPLYPGSSGANIDTTFVWTFSLNNDPYTTESLDDISQTFLTEGLYTVCLTVIENKNGCVDSSCIDIQIYDVPSLTVPNVFTPGTDGVNDEFFFPNLAIVEFSCQVYNRWGVKVFEFTQISDKWDGSNSKNGSECSDGVYFYSYEAKSSNDTEFKGQGNIHLIRK